MNMLETVDPIELFSNYLRVSGVAHTGPEPEGRPELIGKRLGLINGGSWISMWSYYFGRKFLPGVHLINIGNEAVQINFMEAHESGRPTPPVANIDAFVRYGRDLCELGGVDAVMITCSTMNRSFNRVREALAEYGVPVVQIDQPMMEAAVRHGGRILVIATHGPTVNSTTALLRETAEALGKSVEFAGLTIEDAWHKLADGDVSGHNEVIAAGIRDHINQHPDEPISCVVLAQLSMSVFLFSYPDPVAHFGVPVFTSGQCGFERIYDLFSGKAIEN